MMEYFDVATATPYHPKGSRLLHGHTRKLQCTISKLRLNVTCLRVIFYDSP